MAKPFAASEGMYIDEITALLRDQLRQVIKVREPRVLSMIDTPEAAAAIPDAMVEHALQVIGIWLQLLNIAEENAAMRARRQLEIAKRPRPGGGLVLQRRGGGGRRRGFARGRTASPRYHRRATDHHRPPDRSQARDGARNPSPHLFEALRTRKPALDAARAPEFDPCPEERNRPPVADRRNPAGEADRRAGNSLGPALFPRGLVRPRRQPVRNPGSGLAAPLSGIAGEGAAAAEVRVVDRWRPRRQSFRHRAGHPPGADREPAGDHRAPRTRSSRSSPNSFR